MKRYREFEDDPMMKELHEVRERMYLEMRHLSPEERIKRINEAAVGALEEQGYALAPSERKGAYKIVPLKKTP